MTEGIKVPNQEKVRTLGEKETYKYFIPCEADTIKQFKKSISGELESY